MSLGLLGLLALLLLMALGAAWALGHYNRALAEVGRRRGLTYDGGLAGMSPTLTGTIDDLPVVVDVQSDDDTRVRVRVRVAGAEQLEIGGRSSVPVLNRLIDGAGVEVGDPLLDDVARIRGEEPAVVLARMAPATREAVRDLVRAGGRMSSGEVTWLLADARTDVVDRAVGEAVRVASALRASHPTPEALRTRADSDPSPGVRIRALLEAVRGEPPVDWLHGLASGDDPGVVLVAARALGEAGRARLRELLGHEVLAIEAAVALARWPDDPDQERIEAALLGALDREDAVEALGRIGTVRAVPALRAAGGRASDAVRAIQARARGERGGLAIARDGGGEVALAQVARRQEEG